MARVRVETTVNATESVAKVKAACLNVFPDLVFSEVGAQLVGEGSNVEHLRTMLRNEKIRDTARSVMIRHRRGTETSFHLSKQAAYVGRVNFGTGAPLGDLEITIQDEDLDALIDRVAESTVGERLTSRDRTAGT